MPDGKRYPPISVSTGDAKAHCAREVKPEPLPEFSGDRCNGHCDVEASYMRWFRSGGLGSGLACLSCQWPNNAKEGMIS